MSEIREIKTKSETQAFLRLLETCGLRPDRSDYRIGLFEDDELLACGCADRNVLKNLAVSPAARETGAMNTIMTDLVYHLRSKDYENIFLFSKPENQQVFSSLGFHLIARTEKAILMETRKNGIQEYFSRLGKTASTCVVINANPFTLGHLSLIRKAGEPGKRLIVFVLSEDLSYFPFQDRFQMVKGCLEEAGIEGVRLEESGPYIISRATFPTYFLKESDDFGVICSRLDAAIFSGCIAPILGITTRYLGTEESDLATAEYNQALMEHQTGLSIVQVPRFSINGKAVRASDVRACYEDSRMSEIRETVPPFTYHYLYALKLAELAFRSLIIEVMVTPKPGLVDRRNNGSHKDMNPTTFRKSAEAIRPFLSRMAVWGIVQGKKEAGDRLPREIREIGMAAEKAMFAATGGINTHKGAIFSLGLMLYCASVILNRNERPTARKISVECSLCMKDILEDFQAAKEPSTHGEKVFWKHKVGGIREEAHSGYPNAISGLEFYREQRTRMTENDALAWTVVYLIGKVEDSNLYSRSNPETVEKAREKSKKLLARIGEGVCMIEALDDEFIRLNLSPGGSADILALIWFLDNLEGIK